MSSEQPSPIEDTSWIDEVVLRFEQAWQRGENPNPADFVGTRTDVELIAELVQVDLERRFKRGETVCVEKYFECFPALAHDSARAAALWAAEARLHRFGHAPLAGSAETLSTGTQFQGANGSPSASPLEGMPVPRIPGYEILGILGRGGMGIVYRARQTGLGRVVAIKTILSGNWADPEQLARFRAEAEAIARLQHANIVQVYEIGTCQGLPYFSLEYVDGGALDHRLAGVPQPPYQAAALVETLARAVHVAHQRGIVHRDLKPANILLATAGCGPVQDPGAGLDGVNPKIADFGLAKNLAEGLGQTQTGQVMGTPSYMAPEQAVGQAREVGPAVDVYALGAILYEVLTGRPPFLGASVLDTLEQVRSVEPVPPSRLQPKLPRDLEIICLKCLHKSPQGRFASAAQLADDLRRFCRGEPIQARPSTSWERALKWARRRPAAAALIGISSLAALALVALVVGASYNMRLETALDQAQNQRAEADGQRARADALRFEADKQRQLARRYLYFSRINMAQRAWDEANVRRMEELLLEERPARQEQQDFRGFEWRYLWRLRHRNQITFHGHTDAVRCVAFSADGQRLASASMDKSVIVWDAATGKEIVRLLGHTGHVLGVAFGPDGKRLASASEDRTVRIWDANSGKSIATIPAHSNHVTSVAFSPDGKSLASASWDQTVKVWDGASGDWIMTLKGHTHLVNNVTFSPDGKYLASASHDNSVRIWDMATSDEVGAFKGSNDAFLCAAFSPDGQLVAAGDMRSIVRVWNLATGKAVFIKKNHNNWVASLAFSLNGHRLATASYDQTVQICSAATGEVRRTFLGHTGYVAGLAYSPDGGTLASASGDNTVKLWNPDADQEPLALEGHGHWVVGAAFSPDSSRIATASLDKTVKIWDPATGHEQLTLAGHTGFVHALAYSPSGARLASASSDKTIKLWDTATGQESFTLKGHSRTVFRVAFSPDGKQVVSATGDFYWFTNEIKLPGEIKLWNAITGEPLPVVIKGHSAGVTSLAFSHDGKRLASASHDKTIKVWDLTTGKEMLALKGHANAIFSVAFSPDGKRLASGSQDQTVKLWDAGTGQATSTLKGFVLDVNYVAFSPDGTRLATTSSDRNVVLWDVNTGQEALRLKAHAMQVTSLAFSPDGQRLATTSQDATVKIWDATPLAKQVAGK